MAERHACAWEQQPHEDDQHWEAECGRAFIINDGTPYDNRMEFCCYCGGRLVEIPWRYSDDTGGSDDRV